MVVLNWAFKDMEDSTSCTWIAEVGQADAYSKQLQVKCLPLCSETVKVWLGPWWGREGGGHFCVLCLPTRGRQVHKNTLDVWLVRQFQLYVATILALEHSLNRVNVFNPVAVFFFISSSIFWLIAMFEFMWSWPQCDLSDMDKYYMIQRKRILALGFLILRNRKAVKWMYEIRNRRWEQGYKRWRGI